MKNLFNLLCVCVLGILSAQNQTLVYPEWVRNYSDRDSMTNIPAAIDANGNVYVTGSTYAMQQGYNITTVCYNSAGTELWAQHYNGSGNQQDIPNAIIIDGVGDIIITGRTFSNTSYYDFVTLKYNSSGTLLWSAVHNSGGQATDVAQAITLDNNNNIYVAGYFTTATTSLDYAVVRYNPSGAKTGVFTFNGAGNGADRITSIAYNSAKLYLTGYSTNTAGRTDILTMCVNTNNGNVLWSKTYNGLPFFTTANIYDAKLALSNNALYVTGTTENNGNYDFVTIKYNLNNGNQLWAKTYDGYGESDYASAIALSGNDIFVTGRSRDNSNLWEYHTIKYNQAGVAQWINKFSLNTPNISVTNKVAYDSYGMIYVCGEKHTGSNRDMLLVQISANGTTQWNDTYNGTGNSDDAATDMVIDSYGVIYLCGQTYNGNAKFDYTTVKLRQTFAYKPPDLFNQPRSTSFDYVANQGQLINTNDDFVPEIKYYVTNTYPALYFTNDRLSYVFCKADTSQATQDTLHRIDMTFENGNPLARVFAFDTTQGITNYFLAHCPQGITGVKGYERLFVPDIFPNIDVHYYSNNAGLKMYFVLKPGASAKDLNLLFDGQDNLSVVNDNLIITSSIGSTYFERPHAYMVNWGQQTIPVNWQPEWKVDGNRASLITGSWNGPFPLVIVVDKGDLQIAQSNTDFYWSTYLGGYSNEAGIDIKTDKNNNLYIIGYTESPDFPVNFGTLVAPAYTNVFVGKFDSLAVRKWLAYYGGSGHDYGTTLSIYENGPEKYLYACGYTSSSNFPFYPSTNPNDGSYYDNIISGSQDGFIVKFDDIGNRQKSVYFGGCSSDGILSSDVDTSGALVITGYVYASNYCTDFPLKDFENNSYFQDTILFSYTSVFSFIAKFDKFFNQKWGTYFGGNLSDIINGITVNKLNGDIFITGETSSTGIVQNPPCAVLANFGFPLCNCINSYFDSTNATPDAFIVQFNTNGNLLWSSFIGGLSIERGTGVAVNSIGDVYITGYTYTNTGDTTCSVPQSDFFPLCNPYQNVPGNDTNYFVADIFITKFNSNRQLTFSTFYGGSTDESGIVSPISKKNPNITIDNYDNVYITGNSINSNLTFDDFPTLTNLSIVVNQSHNAGTLYGYSGGSTSDAFIIWFNSQNQLCWASLYGGNDEGYYLAGNDKAMAVAVSSNRMLYITGLTNSYSFPLAKPLNPNSEIPYYQPTNSGNTDAFITRIDLTNAQIGINEIKSFKDDFLVYPNPTYNFLIIKSADGINIVKDIKLFNSFGHIIKIDNLIKIDSNNLSINVSYLASGLYILFITTYNKQSICKFIKY